MQVSQSPSHALSQHTPSTQKPDWHAAPSVQAVPGEASGTQAPAAQVRPKGQAASSVHCVGQVDCAPSQAYVPQVPLPAERAGTGEQVPAEPCTPHDSQAPVQAVSQHRPSTQWPEAQSPGPAQAVPGGLAGSHVPPLHLYPVAQPSAPAHWVGQVPAAPSQVYSLQAPCVPAGVGVQVPSLPGWLHASHGPSQVPLQQTPSTHCCE